MTNGRPVTNDRLYDSINAMRLELKGDITRLESKFDQLEAGRLTRLEHDFSNFRVDMNNTQNAEKILSNKFLAGQAIVMVILASISSAFFIWVFGGIK